MNGKDVRSSETRRTIMSEFSVYELDAHTKNKQSSGHENVMMKGFKVIHSKKILHDFIKYYTGFPGGSAGRESTYNSGDPGSIAGSGRSPGEGSGNPLQYSCLENTMNGGAWRLQSTRSQRVTHTTERLTHKILYL